MLAIEDHYYQPEMKTRMAQLTAEKAQLVEKLSKDNLAEKLILHPRMHELYLRKFRGLETTLDGYNENALSARDIIRSMISKVTVGPSIGPNGYDAVLHGDLAMILDACSASPEKPPLKRKLPVTFMPGSQLSGVAGAGFEPTTFRL